MAAAKAKTAAADEFVNPEKKNIFQKMKDSVCGIFSTYWVFMKNNTKTAAFWLVAIIVMYFMAISTVPKVLEWGQVAFSDKFNSYNINIGQVHAKYTRSMWFMGTPEIKFWNPIVDGKLTSYGEMSFSIEQKNGPEGDIDATVAISPPMQMNTTQSYKFMGDGVSGSFKMNVVDGDVSVSNFNMNVNWDLVDK